MKQILMIAAIIVMTAGLASSGPGDSIKSIDLPVVKIVLADGPGKDTPEKYCNLCHSLDYITMQPRFSRVQWTGTVNKMIKTFGAPISDEDAKVIIDYLAMAYGNGQ
jgi:cytochrome c5